MTTLCQKGLHQICQSKNEECDCKCHKVWKWYDNFLIVMIFGAVMLMSYVAYNMKILGPRVKVPPETHSISAPMTPIVPRGQLDVPTPTPPVLPEPQIEIGISITAPVIKPKPTLIPPKPTQPVCYKFMDGEHCQ